MEINTRLKELRKALNLNQCEFGEKIGLKTSAISKMEQSGNTITGQNIKLICEKFNVNREWLTEEKGEMFAKTDESILRGLAEEYKLNEEQLAMVEAFLLLSAEERNVIIKYVKNAASAIETAQDKEIEAKVEAYKQDLLAKKKDTASAAESAERKKLHRLLDEELDAEKKEPSALPSDDSKKAK